MWQNLKILFWTILASLIGIAFTLAMPLLIALGTAATVILVSWVVVSLAMQSEEN